MTRREGFGLRGMWDAELAGSRPDQMWSVRKRRIKDDLAVLARANQGNGAETAVVRLRCRSAGQVSWAVPTTEAALNVRSALSPLS